MYCQRCEAPVSLSDRFCTQCGLNLSYPAHNAGRDSATNVSERNEPSGWNESDERLRAYERLRASEALFQLVWDNAADGMRLTDAEGIVIAVNPAYCRMVGRAREEIEGRPLADVYANADRPFIMQDYARHFTSREFLTFSERKMTLFDGREIWLELSSRITPETAGEPLLITVFRDITSRKHVESQLEESQQRFREIAETVSEVFWSADALTSETSYVNPSYERVWGRSCQSLYDDPKSYLEAIHPEDRDRIENNVARKIAGQPFEHEYRIFRPDGSLRWIWDRGFPVGSPPNGATTRYVGVATDVTERKLAERALRIHSEVLLNMSDGVTCFDEQGVIRLTNRALDTMFGYEQGELIGRPVTVFSDSTPEENTRVHTEVLQAIAATGSWSGELRNRRKDGSVFWTSTRISRLEQADATAFVSVKEDITDRKARDEMLAAMREQLAHASRLGTLGEMATGLAHELNQPLTALHLYASIGLTLGENLEHPQLKSCLKKISDESLRAGEIIRRIRAFAARTPSRHVPLDLNALIHEVLDILSLEIRQKGVRVALKLEASLPSIRADTIHLQQVLVNLIRNAVEAMSQTHAARRDLLISTSVVSHEVCVNVQDSGCGFAPAAASELFQAFHTTKPAGLGLGLAISRSLIEAYGGRITAKSHAAGGATFTFHLPIAPTA